MTDAALSPTPERLRKGDQFQPPAKDQKTDRVAWSALSKIGRLLKDGEIEPEHYQAAEKFRKHLEGSLGIDVRVSSERSSEEPLEFPRSYHAQMLAKVKAHLLPEEFMVVERIVSDDATPVTIGFGLSGYTLHKMQRPYGLCAIRFSLNRLAYFYGFKRQEPPSIG